MPSQLTQSVQNMKKKSEVKGSKHQYGHGHKHHHGHSHGPQQKCDDQHSQIRGKDPHGHNHGHHHHGNDNHWNNAILGLVWGLGMLVLAVGGFNISMLGYYVITGLTSLMTWYLGRNVYKTAWNALKANDLDMSILYSISTLTIVIVSLVSVFVPGLPMMFEAAPLVLGFWHLGEAIEHTLIDEIDDKLDIRDTIFTHVDKEGFAEPVEIKTLVPEDVIYLNHGEFIPVDGVVETDPGIWLYTKQIDGNPNLRWFPKNTEVQQGMELPKTLPPESPPKIALRVKETFENSTLSLIVKNAQKNMSNKAPVELFANQVLKYFIPGLLATAVLSGAIIGVVFGASLAIQCVVSVLVSACPCALSIITPLAFKIGMKKASENGIQFQSGQAIQAAADISDVVFDLNGTLTKGKPRVDSLEIDDSNYLAHIALLERQCEDRPAAAAILAYINQKGIVRDESLKIESIDKNDNAGIKAKINGVEFIVGNKAMLARNDIKSFQIPYNDFDKGNIFIARDGKVIGQIDINDELRDDAIRTVQHLHSLGKKIHICTGAGPEVAQKYVARLGVPIAVYGDAVATLKIGQRAKGEYIKSIQKNPKRTVAMIGDGINDIEALTQANVGVMIQAYKGASKGKSTSIEQYASIIVQKGLLYPIATAFDIGQKTKDNIYQNLFVSLTYNSAITLTAAGAFVGLGFTISPVLGVALMILESTIVLANLYRFKQQEVSIPVTVGKHVEACEAECVPGVKPLRRLGGAQKLSRAESAPPHVMSPFAKPKAAASALSGHTKSSQCGAQCNPGIV